MDIATVGAGDVGRDLASSTARAGHHVCISGADAETAKATGEASGRVSSASDTFTGGRTVERWDRAFELFRLVY